MGGGRFFGVDSEPILVDVTTTPQGTPVVRPNMNRKQINGCEGYEVSRMPPWV
jgi:hypothetical protein